MLCHCGFWCEYVNGKKSMYLEFPVVEFATDPQYFCCKIHNNGDILRILTCPSKSLGKIHNKVLKICEPMTCHVVCIIFQGNKSVDELWAVAWQVGLYVCRKSCQKRFPCPAFQTGCLKTSFQTSVKMLSFSICLRVTFSAENSVERNVMTVVEVKATSGHLL